MARLPQPGSDKGTWGDILNDFLLASHNADGSLKSVAMNAVTGLAPTLAGKANVSDLSAVATSGSYADLLNRPAASQGLQQTVAALQQRRGNTVFALLSDSTGDEQAEWFGRTVGAIASSRPWLTCNYVPWSDATSLPWSDTSSGSYGSPNVVQTGVADVLQSRVVADTFARTVSELVGSKSTPTQATRTWSGQTGLWSVDGAGAAVLAGNQYSGVSISAGLTATKRTLGATLVFDTSTSSKAWALSLGAGTSNRVQLYIFSNAGVNTWYLYKVIGGVGSNVTSSAAVTLPPGGLTAQAITLSVDDSTSTVSATMNGQTISGSLAAADVTALAQGTFTAVNHWGTVTGSRINNYYLDIYEKNEVPTLTAYNGGLAGTTLDYQLARLSRILPVAPDAVFISSSHNETTGTVAAYVAKLDAVCAAIKALYPSTYIILSSQNLELPPRSQAYRDAHRDRCVAIRGYARKNGYGYIAAFEAFRANPNPLQIRIDGLHPTSTNAGYDGAPDPSNGQYVWMQAALTYLASEGIV